MTWFKRHIATALACTVPILLAVSAPAVADQLDYGGGLVGVAGRGDNSTQVGVQAARNGTERVYLVFWGAWGTQTPVGKLFSFSNDPAGAALYVERFLSGMGTNNETWDGVITQYCQGFYQAGAAFGVLPGDTHCPSGDPQNQVAYPSGASIGGSLDGVWYDQNAGRMNGEDIAREATAAAAHFGNTSEQKNLNAQYVIFTPTGATPDGFPSFCAYHDNTLDTNVGITTANGGVETPYGTLYYTLLPYVSDPDSGLNLQPQSQQHCGDVLTNNPNTTDLLAVFTEAEGHEFAETATDPLPWHGWATSAEVNGGSEIGDLCANIPFDSPGGATSVAFATGTFAVQTLWSNDDGGCAASHPVGQP